MNKSPSFLTMSNTNNQEIRDIRRFINLFLMNNPKYELVSLPWPSGKVPSRT